MDALLYIEVLEQTFPESVYSDGHHFMTENIPKHTSKQAMIRKV